MRRYVKIYMGFIRNTLIRDMEFRLNFFVWGIAMTVEMGIHLLFFHNIYGNIDDIAGYDKYEWFFYLGLVQLMLAVFMVFVFPNLVSLPWLINGGELDYLLLKPVNSQFYISLRNANFGYMVNVPAGIILMIYGSIHMKIDISVWSAASVLLYSSVGILILYAILFNLSILSVWLKKADFASTLFFNLWSFMRYPSDVYGKVMRIVFTYLLPVLLICTVPMEIILKKVEGITLLIMLFSCFIWFMGSILLWKIAVKHYSSASS
ncbi:MAG: ABC-2 family transporter protein [Lachnospiraceae bacterium]|nr:ABC-2 family transporter protein [Lachnospiraceae bacterium]